MVKIGIIGGSGLEDPNLVEDLKTIKVTTKFGEPSSELAIGKINGVDVVCNPDSCNSVVFKYAIKPRFVLLSFWSIRILATVKYIFCFIIHKEDFFV